MLGARRGAGSVAELMEFPDALGIEIMPFAEPQITAALDAYRRYGRGLDPKVQLNLGDCAAHALASALGLPLLFKGDDFTHTDVLLVRRRQVDDGARSCPSRALAAARRVRRCRASARGAAEASYRPDP